MITISRENFAVQLDETPDLTSSSENGHRVEIYLEDYQRVAELIAALKVYFDFYNHERPNQSHGGATPGEIYTGQRRLALPA